jgi:hypothetical protein
LPDVSNLAARYLAALTTSEDRPLEFLGDKAHVAEFHLFGWFAASVVRRRLAPVGQKPRLSERTRLTELTSAPKAFDYG